MVSFCFRLSWHHFHPGVEMFWVDLVLVNPFDFEVDLSNLSMGVREFKRESPRSLEFIEIERHNRVALAPKETRTVCLDLTCFTQEN
jgi:hypothetical protein